MFLTIASRQVKSRGLLSFEITHNVTSLFC
jgi:hypothetical protein